MIQVIGEMKSSFGNVGEARPSWPGHERESVFGCNAIALSRDYHASCRLSAARIWKWKLDFLQGPLSPYRVRKTPANGQETSVSPCIVLNSQRCAMNPHELCCIVATLFFFLLSLSSIRLNSAATERSFPRNERQEYFTSVRSLRSSIYFVGVCIYANRTDITEYLRRGVKRGRGAVHPRLYWPRCGK